jgi:hypothetical protein
MCQLGHDSIQLGGREIIRDPAKEQSPDAGVTHRPERRGHRLAKHPRA